MTPKTQAETSEVAPYALPSLIALGSLRAAYYNDINQNFRSLKHAAVASAFIRVLNIDIQKKKEMLMFHIGAGIFCIDSEETGIVVPPPDNFGVNWLYVQLDQSGDFRQYHVSEVLPIPIEAILEMEF